MLGLVGEKRNVSTFVPQALFWPELTSTSATDGGVSSLADYLVFRLQP